MFKVDNNVVNDVVLMFLLLTFIVFIVNTSFSSVSVVDFEQVNASCDGSSSYRSFHVKIC